MDVEEEAYVKGVLGVYELNRIDLIRDVFVRAYRRSCARYAAIRQSLGEPDPFRLRYREQIGDAVRHVVRRNLTPAAASRWIQAEGLTDLPSGDREKFQEVLETELRGLHIGNIARYRLRPAEFEDWKIGWGI